MRGRCWPIPSANCRAGYSAWSAGESWAAARRASPKRSACGWSSPTAAARRPSRDRVALDEFLAIADIVSLHCPLNDATRGLIGARELALMKPDALLINTARGGLIDRPALAAALKAGRLGGAGIDVLTREPPLDGDPLLDDGIPNLSAHASHRLGGARSAPALHR